MEYGESLKEKENLKCKGNNFKNFKNFSYKGISINGNEKYKKKIKNEKDISSKNLCYKGINICYKGINILDKSKRKEQVLKGNTTTCFNIKNSDYKGKSINCNEKYKKNIKNEKGFNTKNLCYKGINELDRNKWKEQTLKGYIKTCDNVKEKVNENYKKIIINEKGNSIKNLFYKWEKVLDENKSKEEKLVEIFRGKVEGNLKTNNVNGGN